MRHPRLALLAPAALLALAGCGGGGGGGGDGNLAGLGRPTGATCPQGSTDTYTNFGRQFMQNFCTECHDSRRVGPVARQDAPPEHNFDTLAGVRASATQIDRMAGAGPDSTNVIMPLAGNPAPDVVDRQRLAQWLACDAPE